jgi:hypothetical protein
MYSSGIPILYPIGFLFFFLTYWFDKMFCKNYLIDFLDSLLICSIQVAQETASILIAFVEKDKNDNEVRFDPSLLHWALHVHQLIDYHSLQDSR